MAKRTPDGFVPLTKEEADAAKGSVSVKADHGKARMDLMPWNALYEIALAMTPGVGHDYGDRNWEKGLAYGRLFSALGRHMAFYWSGEEFDRTTGLRHLAHMGACVLILMGLSADQTMKAFDDRSKMQQLGYVYRERIDG